jgi:hypothetical protein
VVPGHILVLPTCTFGTACAAHEACLDIIHLIFLKMDDTQTWMILLRKRSIRLRGRPGKKPSQYFCTTYSNNYGQVYNVGQLGETWNARDREERAEQRWRPVRRERAPSSTVHACFPYPAAAPLPRYLPWAIF